MAENNVHSSKLANFHAMICIYIITNSKET